MLSWLPGARALQGTVSFQRDLFVNLISELRKSFLITPNQLKHSVRGKWHAAVQTAGKSWMGGGLKGDFFFFWSSEIQETEKPICFYCFLSVTTTWGLADGRKGSCSPLSGYDLCHAKELYLIYNHTIHWLIKNKHKIQCFWAVKIKEFQVWIGFTQDRGNSLSGQRLVA